MKQLLTAVIFLIFLSSCVFSKRATYNYLTDITDTNFHKAVYMADPVIQKTDVLSVQISSAATDPKVDMLYNMNSSSSGGGQQTQQQQGYLVDQQGNIEMPRIGIIHAEGLTKAELTSKIKNLLVKELVNPLVIIRFLNFRITVLGEVGSPGVLNITTERLSILEAVGMAGGVTEYGTIKQVKVLRETNGVREIGQLDLTSQKIFESKYYQLQQNDVILVDQTAYKLRQSEQTRIMAQIGFALTIITSIALLYSFFK
jgi:polysaccharide export outer membrane protein